MSHPLTTLPNPTHSHSQHSLPIPIPIQQYTTVTTGQSTILYRHPNPKTLVPLHHSFTSSTSTLSLPIITSSPTPPTSSSHPPHPSTTTTVLHTTSTSTHKPIHPW